MAGGLEEDAGLRPETYAALGLTSRDSRTAGAAAAGAWRLTYGAPDILGRAVGQRGSEVSTRFVVAVVRQMESVLIERAAGLNPVGPLESFVYELVARAALPRDGSEQLAACAQIGVLVRDADEVEDALAAERLLVAIGVDVARALAAQLARREAFGLSPPGGNGR